MSFWLWKHWFGPWLLEKWGAKPGDSTKFVVQERLRRLAQEMRLPVPQLYFLSDFSPNAVFLVPSSRYAVFVVTDGLLQSLSPAELDAVFCHGLVQLRLWEFRVAPWVTLALFPLASLLSFFPPSFRMLLSLWPQMLVRTLLSPERFSRADKRSAQFGQSGHALAAALQKASALARQIPLRSRHWSWNHLFWISPVEQEFPLLVRTHPQIEQRLSALLSLFPSS